MCSCESAATSVRLVGAITAIRASPSPAIVDAVSEYSESVMVEEGLNENEAVSSTVFDEARGRGVRLDDRLFTSRMVSLAGEDISVVNWMASVRRQDRPGMRKTPGG